MKKNLLTFSIALFLCISGLFAGKGYDVTFNQPQSKIYELSFTLGNYDLTEVTIDNVTYTKLNFEGSVFTRLNGFAELPFLNASVALNGNKNVTLNVIEGDYVEYFLSDPILPSRGIIYRDQDPATIPYQISPSSLRDEWYPQQLASQTSPFIIKDLRGTTVYVYPFRYNAVQNVLRVYKNLTVQLIENDSPVINPLNKQPQKILRELDGLYRTVFINYDQTLEDLTIGEYGDILVICTSRDETAIQPYIDWKKDKGYNVFKEVVSTGTNVKTLIQNDYNANNNILYVQLVGDWADIKSDAMSGAPMDPQLGCVVGSDEFADICIGRFSANNASQVTVQVDKVITYEKYPEAGGSWYTSALGVASNQGPGDDGEYDYQHINVIYNDKLDPFTYENFSTAYDPTGTSTMVANTINAGVSIINYSGHGSEQAWGSTGFNNDNISALNNGNKLPIIFSVACVNGAFNYSGGDCFAEAWLKKANGGAVMTMMSTINQPWNPPMRGEDYFNDMLVGGYDYTTHPSQNGISSTEGRTTIGSIIFNGLTLMCTEAGQNEDWETAKTWTIFGDVAMQPRTDTPGDLALSNELVNVGFDYETTVTGPDGPVENAMVCLSQDGEYYHGVTDVTGSVSIPQTLTPGTAKLVVTGFNMETIDEDITVVPPTGAYLILSSYGVDDSNGNNNGQADYGETVMLDVAAENVGSNPATGVTATLQTSDPYVSVIDNSYTYGNVAANTVVSGDGAFSISVANDVPDAHYAVFDVVFTDNSDSSWTSNMSVMLHAPNIELGDYVVSDPTGNNNGKIDPGETVSITIAVENSGSSSAFNVLGQMVCADPYVTVLQGSQNFGDITSGNSAQQTFTISANISTPAGHLTEFNLIFSADMNISATGSFTEVIGQIPVLILDLDGNNNSANGMQDAIANLDLVAEYSTTFPDDLSLYSSIFVCLGIYTDNHVLTSAEGDALAEYLNNGGNLYMEGGDTWYFDSQTAVHPMFSVNATNDGTNNLGTILGQTGTFTEGMSFNYSGENNYIDHIDPVGSAFSIFKNQSPLYGTGVAYDAGTYRTIACSYEFGGLDDGASPSTKEELMAAYLEFFGYTGNTLQAYFAANNTEICENDEVSFYDMSLGSANSWEWTFEGGSPASSYEQNPIIVYEVAGTYDVTLTVSDGENSSTVTFPDYMIVNNCTAVEENNINRIFVFPNPNNGIFTVELGNVQDENATIKVLNSLGSLVYSEANVKAGNGLKTTLDLSRLNKGMYFLVIENCQGNTVKRIIIR